MPQSVVLGFYGMTDGQEIRGILLDIEGTIIVAGKPVSGAPAAIERLRRRGFPLRFLTNTTTLSAASLRAQLEGKGIAIGSGELITPAAAAVRYLKRQGASSCRMVVCEELLPDFAELDSTGGRPDFIVIGDIGPRWDYDLMSELFRLVMEGARIVALHKGRFWQTEEGLTLDIGAFIAGLEYATGSAAVVMGKPAESFFRFALEGLAVDAGRALIVGDDADSDIAGAAKLGIRGVLVRTGKFRPDWAERTQATSWRIIDSVASLPTLLE